MDLSEIVMGRIPGFYTLVILATIYLMLPMFRGADKVFRKILVPLAGLQEVSSSVSFNLPNSTDLPLVN